MVLFHSCKPIQIELLRSLLVLLLIKNLACGTTGVFEETGRDDFICFEIL